MDDELGLGLAVDRRLGVGHGGHRRDPAGDGRRGAGGDGLVLLPPWFAEVDVHVDPAGRDDEAGGVDGAIGSAAGLRAGGEDAVVFDPQIGDGVEVLRRIDDAAVGDAEDGHEEILGKRTNHRGTEDTE